MRDIIADCEAPHCTNTEIPVYLIDSLYLCKECAIGKCLIQLGYRVRWFSEGADWINGAYEINGDYYLTEDDDGQFALLRKNVEQVEYQELLIIDETEPLEQLLSKIVEYIY